MTRQPSMKILISFLGLAALTFQYASGQTTQDRISGSWMGTMNAGGTPMRLGFNISLTEEGAYKATLDSPDQGALGIPVGEVSLTGDSIKIDAPMLRGYYLGKLSSKTTIEGEWNQSNQSFALILEKQEEALVMNRPQEPQPPFPYTQEEVSFKNKVQDFSLGGTLTIPPGEGPFPAVVMVTGSGSQNRDEEIFGHKPFKLIADYLSRQGIAVLRYDDRGVGSSGGNAIEATTADLAVDARSAMEYLQERQETDPRKVGIVGHSEGGMIAMILASSHEDIAFIVSLAGPGVDGLTTLIDQGQYMARLSGASDSILEDKLIVMTKLYEAMVTHEDYKAWGEEVLEFTSSYYSQKESAGVYSDEEIAQIKENLLGSIPESVYAWLRYFVIFDPAPVLQAISCPVLALNGAKDCQVLPEKNISAISDHLKESGNKHVTTQIVPGLNHLFQHCDTGLPDEYGVIEESFDPLTLELMTKWILDSEARK